MNRHTPPIPYYAQWESSERAADFISGRLPLAGDPKWRESGAATQQEYATWANHICGMACLKMILAARTGRVYPTMRLTELARTHGAYVLEGEAIRGMIYAPFVKMIKAEFGIDAEVLTNLSADDIAPLLGDGSMFIASVHPSVRWLADPPPRKGGHLVLVEAANQCGLVFHNPSGHDSGSQSGVVAPVRTFELFFAGRGIRIRPPAARLDDKAAEKAGEASIARKHGL